MESAGQMSSVFSTISESSWERGALVLSMVAFLTFSGIWGLRLLKRYVKRNDAKALQSLQRKQDRREEKSRTNLGRFLGTINTHHPFAFGLFVALPLVAATLLLASRNVLFQAVGFFGLLITSLSAFYSASADWHSREALTQARVTYDSVLQFAESLESFANRLTARIIQQTPLRDSGINVQFLSVIPAFASVGLEDIYVKREDRSSMPPDRFHVLLARKLESPTSQLNLLTHDGIGCMEWLAKLQETIDPSISDDWEFKQGGAVKRLDAGDTASSLPRELEVLRQRLSKQYLTQKSMVYAYTKLSGLSQIRIWNTDGQRIPFQFVVLKSEERENVFFLFSGDQLYSDGLSKLRREKLHMKQLRKLTRGYYLGEGEREMVDLFKSMFEDFSDRTPVVKTAEDCDAYFPNRLKVIASSLKGAGQRTMIVDISAEFQGFKSIVDAIGPRGKCPDDAWVWLRNHGTNDH